MLIWVLPSNLWPKSRYISKSSNRNFIHTVAPKTPSQYKTGRFSTAIIFVIFVQCLFGLIMSIFFVSILPLIYLKSTRLIPQLQYSAGPWCFDLPGQYYGHANVTVGGLSCLRWDSFPQNKQWSSFPDRDIHAAENYCRNPDGDIWPWCFTGDPDVPFDFCSIEDLACHLDEKLWDEIKIDAVASSTGSEWISESNTLPYVASSSPQLIFQITLVVAPTALFL